MNLYTYEFECIVLIKKILKLAKKKGLKSFFKEGFEFKSQYYIGIDTYEWDKVIYKVIYVECMKGEFYRLYKIPLKRKGWDHLDPDQAPDCKTVEVLQELYTFLKA